MFRGRFLLPIIGLFVVFSLIWSVGNNRRQEQEAWMQGYMAGQMSVQPQGEGGAIVNPMPYAMYGQGFRGGWGGGPGFFGIIPVLLLGFVAFKVIRGGLFRRWQQAGGAAGFDGWGEHPRNHYRGRGPWGEGYGPRQRGNSGTETPAQDRTTANRPTDDDVI